MENIWVKLLTICWFSISSQSDSNILQLLRILGRILVPPVTQLFRSKWLPFFFQCACVWNVCTAARDIGHSNSQFTKPFPRDLKWIKSIASVMDLPAPNYHPLWGRNRGIRCHCPNAVLFACYLTLQNWIARAEKSYMGHLLHSINKWIFVNLLPKIIALVLIVYLKGWNSKHIVMIQSWRYVWATRQKYISKCMRKSI